MYSYFEKVDESAFSNKTYELLGEPQLDYRKWLETQKQ